MAAPGLAGPGRRAGRGRFRAGAGAEPLIRVVLAQVPTERAGVGGGVLATTQQVSLALGVATLGRLFLTLADRAGMRDALVITLAMQVAAIARRSR